jgi:hypothetical protein
VRGFLVSAGEPATGPAEQVECGGKLNDAALEATAYSAQGEVAYFQEIYIPPNRRKLLFDSELRY